MTDGYLLDSHAFLWLADSPDRIPSRTHDLLASAPSVFVSAVTIAELCIKSALGKLSLPAQVEAAPLEGFQLLLERMAISSLDLALAHAARLRTLPRNHGDPFDRLLVAQAMAEDLTLITHDRTLAAYAGLAIHWV